MDASSASGIRAVTVRVVELFKEHWLRERCPTEVQCYELAVWIGIINAANPSYQENFRQQNIQLRKDRSIVEAKKRLVERKQAELRELRCLSNLPDYVRGVENLEALAAAIDEAIPTLLPSDPLAGERDSAWWHKAARLIAGEVIKALVQAGNGTEKLSFAKGGPLVRIVAGCLKLAGINKAETTIAAVLQAYFPR
jgi:hypothetical protein